MDLDFATLKSRHRKIREGFSTALALRTHRALSWLNRAEQEPEDWVSAGLWQPQMML